MQCALSSSSAAPFGPDAELVMNPAVIYGAKVCVSGTQTSKLLEKEPISFFRGGVRQLRRSDLLRSDADSDRHGTHSGAF